MYYNDYTTNRPHRSPNLSVQNRVSKTSAQSPKHKNGYKPHKLFKAIFAFDLICLVALVLLAKNAYAHSANELANEASQTQTASSTLEVFHLENSGKALQEKLDYINEHPEFYGDALVEVANKSDELIDFVYDYPSEFGGYHNDDVSGEVDTSSVPLLYQFDKRWGYQEYSGGLLGYTGCGPTSLSMVLMYLTKDTAITPAKVAEYATEAGYSCDGSGSYWTLMSEGCEHYGVSSFEVPLNEGSMIEALEAGQPIICIMGAGEFTDNGHFIVLTDYVDGKFKVNDCFSPSRSKKLWSYDEIYDQIRNMWRFYLSE